MPALSPLFPWGPAIDGAATGLRDMPLAIIQRGAHNKVPVIAGTNKNEGSIFVPIFTLVVPGASFPPADKDIPAMMAAALRMYPAAAVARATDLALSFYPKSAYPPGADNFWRATDLITHLFFTCGTRRSVRAMAQFAPTYLYTLDYNLSLAGGLAYALLGDYHSAELAFVFANEWPLGLAVMNADDRALSEAIQGMWASMAATGEPGVPYWPQYNATGDEHLIFAAPPLATGRGLQNVKCDMFDEVAAILRGAVE